MPCEACLQPFERTKRPSDEELCSTLRVTSFPYGADFDAIQEDIANAKSELERLEEEIARTQTRARWLISQRQPIQSFLALKEAALAPVRRLPTEILLEIFLIVSPNVTITSTSGFPWQLAHVCSHWRDVVLSSPSLWSYIWLGFPNHPISNVGVRKACKILNLCLVRSGGHPLSIRLWAHGENEAITRDIVKIALRVRERWRDLEYVGGEFVNPNTFLPPTHFPMLRNLLLYPPHNTLSIIAPDVKWLDLRSPPKPSVQTLTRAWPRITRLKLTFQRISQDDFARTLLQLPELSELDILHLVDTDNSFIPVRLDRLLILKVTLGNSIIGNLTTPNLRTLLLKNNSTYTHPESGHIIIELLRRSCCSITRLTLSGQYFSTGIFIGIMGITPDVKHLDFLVFERSRLWDPLMHKQDFTLLPHLHTLNLGVVTSEEYIDVVRVVKSRADPPMALNGHNSSPATGGRLRNLSLHLHSRRNEQRLDVALPELIQGAGGLKVDFDGDQYPIVVY